MKKRISSLLLALALCLSLVGTAFADWENTPYGPQWKDDDQHEVVKPEKPTVTDRDDDDDDDDDDDVISIIRAGTASQGSVTCSPSNPRAGDTVTVTGRPKTGYELQSITVKDSKGKTVAVTKVGDNKFTFVMPAGKVTITPVFGRIAAQQSVSFSDVPASHTFYGDISWVASKGYMGGYGDGSFRPSANTTRQALWMVLARIDGANPSDMAAARSWAIQNGISDGTSAGGAMTRQQMVTMLYRYAQSKGYKTTGGVSLAGFSDASSVASYAQEAMSWAVGNGIVQGTGAGALNPGGTATRAHFAAFLHRFCVSAGIA